MPNISLEFKDWLLIITFGITLITTWTRIKFRMDRADEVHDEIKNSLSALKSTLGVISIDIGEIKTSVAVIENEQGNLGARVGKLEV